METSQAVILFAALAQETRLAALRALVQAGPNGLAAGRLAERVGVSPSNLSFHLKELSDGRQSWVPSDDWRSRPVSTPATFPAALRILA